MRYAKKRASDVDWRDEQEQAEREQEKLVRLRRREAPMGAKLTRKMAKMDAQLLAMAVREDPTATVRPAAAASDSMPPPSKRAVQPPPLPIPFPFPFASSAASSPFFVVGSTAAEASGIVAVTGSSTMLPRDESFINVHDSWLLPQALPGAEASLRVNVRSLVPREPDPFTIVPPHFSLPPR